MQNQKKASNIAESWENQKGPVKKVRGKTVQKRGRVQHLQKKTPGEGALLKRKGEK